MDKPTEWRDPRFSELDELMKQKPKSRGGRPPKTRIDPDIAALTISRQNKVFRQRLRNGVCRDCGGAREEEMQRRCLKCQIKVREKSRRRHRNERRYTNAKTYRLAGQNPANPDNPRPLGL